QARELGLEGAPLRHRVGDQAPIDAGGDDERLALLLTGQRLAEARGQAGAALGVNRVIVQAAKHRRETTFCAHAATWIRVTPLRSTFSHRARHGSSSFGLDD